jgi:hypothetical protein
MLRSKLELTGFKEHLEHQLVVPNTGTYKNVDF